MALWDMVKKGAEEGLEALKEGVSVFLASAGIQSRILKKKVELSSVQNDVRKAFGQLGSLVYDIHSRGEEEVLNRPQAKDLFAQIEGYKARVRVIEAEIEKIKQEEEAKASLPTQKSVKTEEKEPPPSETPTS